MTTKATALVRAYHQRSKHRLAAYAAGPETLDWDAVPDPCRRYDGSPLTPLPLVADELEVPWAALGMPGAVAPQALTRDTLAALLELSLALTAWKEQGPDRWALRANPSSGNLHPTEAYVLADGVPGLRDGLHHYQPHEHALALRRPGRLLGREAAGPRLWLALSSIHWREAWKYGERAFRYCQLDAGHALGAVRYAAAVLGWPASVLDGLGHAALATLLGLDRDEDFGRAEREEPELLLHIGPGAPAMPAWHDAGPWAGRANRLDPHPMYRWPVIDEVAAATRAPSSSPARVPQASGGVAEAALAADGVPAAALIRQRRSAQRFDRQARMPRDALARLLAALVPGTQPPWDLGPRAGHVHAVLWVHRVDGLEPGAYLLPRGEGASRLASLATGEALRLQPGCELHPLGRHPALATALRTLSCHQALAAEACVVISLLAEFELPAPWVYRDRLQEAGLIGQVLYLQAEALGFRGTGIGCYFDDELHGLLGLAEAPFQVLYQFTVGRALADDRVRTGPPYAGRPAVPRLAAAGATP